MDNLSSADLDASSKTPLFIGIAAVIIAVIGFWLGWLGFSKANDLEARIAEISGAAESLSKLESAVDANSEIGTHTSVASPRLPGRIAKFA